MSSINVFVLLIVTATLACPPKAEAVIRLGQVNMVSLTNGLVGYWTFDGPVTNWNTNTTADLSGNGNTGQLVNMSTTTSPAGGKIGQALKFDGSSSYVTIPYNASLYPINITVSYWMKESAAPHLWDAMVAAPDDSSGVPYFSDMRGVDNQHPTFGTYYDPRGAVDFVAANTSLTVGKWYHIVGTFDGWRYKIYINGILDNTLDDSTALYQGASSGLNIGSFYYLGTPSRFFNGTIDDVRIYNRALPAQEVKQLYNLGTANIAHSNTVISNGLVGYWTFDGPVTNWNTNTTMDLSGNGNTGTLVNMSTTSSPAAGKIGQDLKFSNLGGSHISIPYNAALNVTTEFTISAWVKPYSIAGASTNYVIFSKVVASSN